MAIPVIRLQNATVSYTRGHAALHDITLAVAQGSMIAVVGPNGAGKTTLFRAILGLTPTTKGSVETRGRAAYVPQREAVDWQFPLTAEDIVTMGRIHTVAPGRRPTRADRYHIVDAMKKVGMLDRRNAPIARLSGGQQQRIFLARALAQNPEIFLLDEPFNEIDAATQELLLGILDEFAAAGRTIMVATHDLRLARERFAQTLLLNRGIIAYDTTEKVFQPTLLEEAYAGQVVIWRSNESNGCVTAAR